VNLKSRPAWFGDVLAVDRETRRTALAQARTQLEAAEQAFAALYDEGAPSR
jgi:hypothetical protein